MRPSLLSAGYILSLALLFGAGSACTTTWSVKPLADPRLVARALDDNAELPGRPFDPASVPSFKAPTGIRPCCAFGMDLRAKLGEAPVPGYKNGNVLGSDEIGPHGYDKGLLPGENNGLVYTCRGGFIDIAHIRDNGDRTLYLAMEIAQKLPAGFTIEMPEEATRRQVIVKPIPAELLARYGRWHVATMLAEYVNYQFSVWHEIATWYDWQSIKGVSERLSAFSLEDLYSNVVGQRLAAGIVKDREANSQITYDRAMDAWIPEALRRLGAVSRTDGRRAMQAVDGLWWDSKQRVPDFKLVLRRDLVTASPKSGWLVTEAVGKGPVRDELKQMCAKQPAPLPLSIPERLGDLKMEDLITIQFEFTSWIPKEFPVPFQKGSTFTQTDFPAIIKAIRASGEKELGPGYDQPRPLKETGGPLVSQLFPALADL